MPSKRETLLLIAKRAQEDSSFFHKLVFDPTAALADVEGVDRETVTALAASRLPDFLGSFLAGAVKLNRCDPTCGEGSCSYTCGPLSCDDTCVTGTCGQTCGPNSSCVHTIGVFARA
jgi:hypothetical protein